MYIAVKNIIAKSGYVLRESYMADNGLTFRTLADLGEDPSAFIVYPGGNGFYIDQTLEELLLEQGTAVDSDEMEALFWPWVRPDIKRAVETFRNRSNSGKKNSVPPNGTATGGSLHDLDKRRSHFLKFGAMDQGAVENMPKSLFQGLQYRSRDEIEQYFLVEESLLKDHDLKSYVYTVFNLQAFFQGFMAKKMPHALDQKKVDDRFIQELCRIDTELFGDSDRLSDYLLRYLLMFFDHDYAPTTLLGEFYNDFVFRHHFHNPPPPRTAIKKSRAMEIFGISREEIKTMDKPALTRRYRQLARLHHPDKGGKKERFVEITDAFHSLLEKL